MHSVSRGSKTFAAMAAAVALLLVPTASAHAQERPAAAPVGSGVTFTQDGEDRARLGVFLRPGCEISADATGTCPTPPVVMSIVDDAPAAMAGVMPGDTLLSLDGISLKTAAGRRSMARLSEGVPVRLDVQRGSTRQTLRVVPTARPAGAVYQVRGNAWTESGPGTEDVHVYRFRDGEGYVSEFRFAPTPQAPPQPNGYVIFREDDRGELRVDFGRPEVEVRTLDGQLVELSELATRLEREGALALRPDDVDVIEVEVTTGRGAPAANRLILENAPLARRLETLRASTLSDARSRLDSVVRVRVDLARRGELPPTVASSYSYVVPRPAPVGGRQSVAWVDESESGGVRLAGAEFRALTPDLADYFQVDAGLLVLRVIPETPAGRLGLRGGDVVTEVGGHKMPDINVFRRLVMAAQSGGGPLEVKWNRKGVALDGDLTTR